MGFAAKTDVPVEKTKHEIETTLKRYHADQFVSGWNLDTAFVMFRCRSWFIRFQVAVPKRTERRFTHTDRHKPRTQDQAQREYDQAVRTVWRRLLLCIKAKLESVESGIETFEEAFLAHIVLPGNTTVGEWAKEALPEAYRSNDAPKSLLALPPHDPGE